MRARATSATIAASLDELLLASLVLLAPRPVAPGDILFGCGPIQDVLTYPGQPKVSIAQDQVDACKATGLGARVISDCHFRKTDAEYDRKPGIKWLRCTEK